MGKAGRSSEAADYRRHSRCNRKGFPRAGKIPMRAADVLEFESLRKLLGRYISSPQGVRELEKLAPHVDRARLTEDLAEAAEAVAYLRLAPRPQPAARGAAIRVDFGGLPDTQAAVQKLRIEGASLDPREIYDLFALLDRAADAKSVLTAAAERFPRLGRRAQTIGDFRGLLREQVVDLLRVEAGAFNPQLLHGGLGVGQASEIHADGRAARGRLRAQGEAQVGDRLGGFGQVFGQALAVHVRRQLFQLAEGIGRE